MLLASCLAALALSACDPPPERGTTTFQRAEAAFAQGDYDGAVRLYRTYLELYPESPFADLAQRRIQTIERELDTIMGRRGAPAPVYIAPSGRTEDEGGDDWGLDQIQAPHLPALGEVPE